MKTLTSKLLFLVLPMAFALMSCGGGDPKQNPHNERFIAEEIGEENITDSETITTDNEVGAVDDTAFETEIKARNLTCSTDGATLSNAPVPEFVMVGKQGLILISTDGQDWSVVENSPTNEDLNGIVKGRNIFVAVGNNGTAICSPNGHDWFSYVLNRKVKEKGVERLVKETEHLNAIATNGNQFVGVGANGLIYTNTSNTEWSRIAEGSLKGNLYDVTWGGGQFIAVGGDADAVSEANIIQSANGINWSVNKFSTDQGLRKIAWSGHRFVAGGSRVKPAKQGEDACTKDCLIEHYLYVSDNGYDWVGYATDLVRNITDSNITAVGGDATQLFAIGHGVDADNGNAPTTFKLSSASKTIKWQVEFIPDIAPKEYRDLLLYEDITFMLASNASEAQLSVVSDNTQNPATVHVSTVELNDIARAGLYPAEALCPGPILEKFVRNDAPIYYGSLYVLVGSGGSIYISPKAEVWSSVNSGTKHDLRDVVRGKNSFYVVGDEGTLLCSRNGLDWHTLPSNTTKGLTSIATDGQLYVAAGEDGLILSSVNGIQWDKLTIADGRKINQVIWGGNIFVAVGGDLQNNEAGFIYTSADGVAWTDRSPSTISNPAYLNDVIWTGTQYVAVGLTNSCVNSVCSTNNLILKSDDGVTWTEEEVPINKRYVNSELSLVASRGNEIVVIGRGSIDANSDVLITASNNQIVPWKTRDFSEAATDDYYDILLFEGSYWLAGTKGVLSTTSTGLENITVTVVEDVDIHAVAINSNLPETALPNTPFSYTPVIADKEGQRLIFLVTGLPAWAEYDRSTGMVFGIPSDTDVDSTSTGIRYTIKEGSSEQLGASHGPDANDGFVLTVVANNPPNITGSPPTVVTVLYNETFYFAPTAYDTDFQPLTFSIENMPAWAIFNSTTGVLSGTPTQSDLGTYDDVTISVSDGANTASLAAFSISVVYLPKEFSL